MSSARYTSITLDQLVVGEPLPGNLFISIESRFITLRALGDALDRTTYDRLQFKNVANLFVLEEDLPKFQEWAGRSKAPDGPPGSQENKEFINAWKSAHRKTLDIFQAQHPDPHVQGVINASKKLVAEVMKFPYAVQSLAQLQSFSRGTVDHSVNVATLSVYLAMQMGYSHTIILQHVCAGALLHDVGKRKVDILDSDTPQAAEAKMREHPTLGLRILEQIESVPNEVKMIVAQHHEFHDGSGYPKKLRGANIYDLARIVTIANEFDGLVADGKGPLPDRQKAALSIFDTKYFNKIDPDKHDKALRILKLGV